MSDEILIRRGSNADVPFITSSWLKSYRNSPAVQGVPNRVFFTYHHRLLESILPEAEVWVACNAVDHDQIIGWICSLPTQEALVVHYAYVKQVFRGHGIAGMLFRHLRQRYPDPPVVFTHKTPLFWKKGEEGKKSFFSKIRERGFVYHPYLLHAEIQ